MNASSPNPAPIAWLASYDALTSGCGLADLSTRTRVDLTGADRVQFLHSFCTNDIKRLLAGEGCEAFLTNHQGKTVGHIYIRVMADSLVLDTAPDQAAKIIQHLERFVIADRVEFRDLTSDTAELLLAGRGSQQMLASASGKIPPVILWRHELLAIAGVNVCVQRVEYAGESALFLTAAREEIAVVRQTLEGAGAIVCHPQAIEAARIEAGVPLFGSDITDDNLPQEIGRNQQAISFTKGCYLGQETVARIDALGHVNRMLVGMKLPAAQLPPAGMELSLAGKPVGKITTACWSPRLGTALAFALIRRAQAAPGAILDSPLGPAQVIALPLTP